MWTIHNHWKNWKTKSNFFFLNGRTLRQAVVCSEGAIGLLRSWRSGIWDSPMTKSRLNCSGKTDDCQRRQTSYIIKLPWRRQCWGKIKGIRYIWYSHRLHSKSSTSGTVHRYLPNCSNRLAPELNVPMMSRKLEFKWDTIWQISMPHIQHSQHYAAWSVYLTLGSKGLIPVLRYWQRKKCIQNLLWNVIHVSFE
jgi:hypothetical protein